MKSKLFFQYVIPSMLAFALSGVYSIVDGFFIGNSLQDAGLAAINIAYPICAFVQAVGTGVGLAGAIRFTILRAQGKHEEGNAYFSGTVLLLLLVSVMLTLLCLLLSTTVLRLLGAEGYVLQIADEYIRVIAVGAIFQIYGTGLVPFIRNMGGAAFAMAAMIAGFLTNILLDYLFVWLYGWGMAGAAWATIIGRGTTMLCAVWYLLSKRMRLKFLRCAKLLEIFRSVFKISISPFGLTFSPNIILILMNRFLLIYGGEQAVASYACISYITSIVYLLLQGVGDGSQPLISKCYGKNALQDMKRTRSLAYWTGFAVTILCMIGVFSARSYVGILFGASETVGQNVAQILPLFLSSLLFLSFVRITTAYFYATEQSKLSYVMVYAEPIFVSALLLVLPLFAGLNGVWASVPLAQALTWIAALFAKHRVDKQCMAL